MKLTVIGCWGGYPAPNSATSSYLIENDNFSLLIDVGSGALSKLQKYKQVSDLDAVIVSHYHHDHVADIGVLQYAKLVQSFVEGDKEVLPIYGHAEDKQGFDSLTHHYTKGVAYDPVKGLKVGPFDISFLQTNHPVPCYGMRITDGTSTIVYTADTSYKEAWVDFARDADLLITDCNFYADQDASIAENANVKNLLLSHLPQYGDNQQLVQEAKLYFKGDVHLAKEGFTWD